MLQNAAVAHAAASAGETSAPAKVAVEQFRLWGLYVGSAPHQIDELNVFAVKGAPPVPPHPLRHNPH